jgi:hypothetical protein
MSVIVKKKFYNIYTPGYEPKPSAQPDWYPTPAREEPQQRPGVIIIKPGITNLRK